MSGRRVTDVAIFAPGLAEGGGAEKTALVTAQTLASTGLRVACFDDSGVSRVELGVHFGLDLDGVELRALPSIRLPTRVPQAVRDLVRDWLFARAIRRTNPRLFLNMKFKSELPGLGDNNWYYVHFPHRLEHDTRSRQHFFYLQLVAGTRRAVLARGVGRFIDSYQVVLANSEFTRDHVCKRWNVRATIAYPPCAQAAGVDESARTKTILNVGRFQADGPQIPHKRQDVLIRAFAQMPDLAAAGWSLHLVGAVGTTSEDRTYFEHIRRLAGDLPIHVHANASHELLTDLTSHARVYWHAQGYGTDIAVHPEAQEHFGISTVEAMAAGIVPLVYATAGPAEVVQDESELMWRTPQELVAKTRALITSGRWEHWHGSCRRRAAEFSNDAFARQITALYRSEVGPLPESVRGER